MRWFIVFLLIANVAFFLWMQQDARRLESAAIAPPDIGRLQLVDKAAPSLLDEQGDVEGVVDRAQPRSFDHARDRADSAGAARVQPALADANHVAPSPTAVIATTSPSPSEPRVVPPSPRPEVTTNATATVESDRPATAQASDAGAAAAIPTPAPATVAQCYRVGPLANDDADQLIATLADTAELLSDRVESTRVSVGYYVLIPPLGSIAEGNEKLKALKDAGVSDTWLFRQGEYRFAISLGLFSSESNAKRRAAKVAAKGFDVEVRERNAVRDRRWLELKTGAVDELDRVLPQKGTVTARPCQ